MGQTILWQCNMRIFRHDCHRSFIAKLLINPLSRIEASHLALMRFDLCLGLRFLHDNFCLCLSRNLLNFFLLLASGKCCKQAH